MSKSFSDFYDSEERKEPIKKGDVAEDQDILVEDDEEFYDIESDERHEDEGHDAEDEEVEETVLHDVGFSEKELGELMMGRVDPSMFPDIPKEKLHLFEKELQEAFERLDFMGLDSLTEEQRNIKPVQKASPMDLIKLFEEGKHVVRKNVKGRLVTCVGYGCDKEIFVSNRDGKRLSAKAFLCHIHK